MDIRHLETFYWAVRLGSFGAAASQLNTTQPAISKRIRQLENSLGVKLFQGNTRNTRPTAQGWELKSYASQAVGLMATIRQRVGRPDAVTGLVRVGATDIIALTWLPDLVARLRDIYPNLSVELLVDLTVNLRARLDRHELDVAFLLGPVTESHLVRRSLGLIEMSWMASPILDLPTGPVTPGDLARMPVVSHTQGTDHFNLLQSWFRDAGVNPPLFNGCSSLSTLIKLTTSGIGTSVLPLGMMRREIELGDLRALNTEPPFPPHHFDAVFPADDIQPLASEIVEMAVECAAADPLFRPPVDATRSRRRSASV